MEENSYSKLKIEQLIRSVRDVESQVREGYNQLASETNSGNEGVPVVVFIGPTGSGKTTLYYALNNKELEGYRENTRRRLKAKNPEDNFKIGHSGFAETTIPGLKYDPGTKIIYCDCPGFFDNRSDIQDITNSFAINHVLDLAKNVKILLLTSISDVVGSKGKVLRESCQMIEKLIPEKNELLPSIGLIITNVNPEDCVENATFLDDVECANSWLLLYFKQNETGRKKCVYCFPYPKNENFGEPLKDFTDREKVLAFIKKDNAVKLNSFVSLSNEAKLMILGGVDSFGDLSILLRLFVERIRIDISESDSNLQLWKERVDRYIQCKFTSPADFVEKSREIINPSSNLYDSAYNQIMKIDDWRNFLEKVIVDDVQYKDEIINRESSLLRPVFLDITKFFDELISPVVQILNSKIDKYKDEQIRKELLDELKKQQEENLKLVQEISDEKIKTMKKEEESKRQIESLNNQMLSLQRDAENLRTQLAMAQNQGGGGNGGLLGSLMGGALGGYLISLL